jgi:hypothetical protein
LFRKTTLVLEFPNGEQLKKAWESGGRSADDLERQSEALVNLMHNSESTVYDLFANSASLLFMTLLLEAPVPAPKIFFNRPQSQSIPHETPVFVMEDLGRFRIDDIIPGFSDRQVSQLFSLLNSTVLGV